MSFYNIVFSATGRTQSVAEIVSSVWEEPKTLVDVTKADFDGSSLQLTQEDVCLVAMGVYGGRIPQPAPKRLETIQGNGAKVILLAVYGNRAVDDALAQMQDILTRQGFVCVAAMEAVAEHSMMPRYGAGRPDAQDKKELIAFAKEIQIALSKEQTAPLQVPGKVPEGEAGSMPLSIQTDRTCKNCGKCARECPVGAISKENARVTDKDKCILCMRCTAVCPVHAKHLPGWFKVVGPLKMGKALSGHKKNTLYLPR